MTKLRLKGPIHLVCSEVDCWKCHRATPVFAIEASDLKDLGDAPDAEPLGCGVFVHGIEGRLPDAFRDVLMRHAQNFVPAPSRTAGATYWGNLCVHCQALQGDFYLHAEPDGPFFAGPKGFQGTRVLLTEKNVEIAAGTYAY